MITNLFRCIRIAKYSNLLKFYGKIFIFKDFMPKSHCFSKCSHWWLIFMNVFIDKLNKYLRRLICILLLTMPATCWCPPTSLSCLYRYSAQALFYVGGFFLLSRLAGIVGFKKCWTNSWNADIISPTRSWHCD